MTQNKGRCHQCFFSAPMTDSNRLWCARHGNMCQRVAWGCRSDVPSWKALEILEEARREVEGFGYEGYL